MASKELVVHHGIMVDGRFEALTNFSFEITEHVKAKKWSGYLANVKQQPSTS